MTRIFVQRGSSTNRASSAASQASTQLPSSSSREEESVRETHEAGIGFDEVVESFVTGEDKTNELVQETDKEDAILDKNLLVDVVKSDDVGEESTETQIVVKELGEPRIGGEILQLNIGEGSSREKFLSSPVLLGGSSPPPPPVPPPKLSSNTSLNSRRGGSRGGLSRRSVGIGWPPVGNRTSPVSSRPSSPRGHVDSEGYNSADEQIPSYGPYGPSYNDAERERQFELDIRRIKGLELRRMLEDGNCLFRAVAHQVYGDPELHELTRQMCIDYMERERDHFSQFVTEGFTSYCNRKRRDKVYGNNLEIQALCEMYNRPIHIYSYSTEPINIFQGGYNTDSPPIRLSYHQGNHYNSLVDPRRLSIGAGLGFSNLQGTNIDKDKVKAVIKAQEDQQIGNAILAEGRFYSDLELTEKEIERMVIETSRAEYLAKEKYGARESSTSSGAEPSSSGARPSSAGSDSGPERKMNEDMLSSSMQVALSMGFSYIQAVEAYSIFGEDVDSMICYLLETGGNSPSTPNSKSRRKGKATER